MALAAAWMPRGELARFRRLLPLLEAAYSRLVVSLPPAADAAVRDTLDQHASVHAVVTPDWSWGRYAALQGAVQTGAAHIHYADFDRLLRWAETRPEEWLRALDAVRAADYLVIGRTPAAYATHPRALVETEAISNRTVSFLIGRKVDASAGSKGFSRRAAEYVLANTKPGRALGSDAEWTVLLHRAGFTVDTIQVDGLDWESADRFQHTAAGSEGQRLAAQAFDADPQNWAHRVAVAKEIVEAGLEAAHRGLGKIYE